MGQYIESFERAVNLMRDNPSLPDDYYTNSFIAGLSDYIQAHLQCNKPKDLQDAMWMARRLEQAANSLLSPLSLSDSKLTLICQKLQHLLKLPYPLTKP